MNYRIEKLEGFSIVGLQERVNTNNAFTIIPDLWTNAAKAGLFERLWEIRTADPQMRGILGVCADGDFGKNEEFHYILSIVSEQVPPKQMIKRDFLEATWAVFEAEGGPEGTGEIWKRFIQNGFQPLAMTLLICLLLSVICPQKNIKMSYG